MGEVKSTLEIALEKADALKVSSEDRKRFKHEEALSRARDILRLYTNDPQKSSGIEETIQESGEDRTLLQQCLTEVFLEALDPSHTSEVIWEGLGELGLRDAGSFQAALTRIAEEHAGALKEEAEKIGGMLRDSLAKAGISGTAVEPNVEQSPQWEEIANRLDQARAAQLDRLRREIATAIEKNSSSPR